jgi:hypothetical protein
MRILMVSAEYPLMLYSHVNGIPRLGVVVAYCRLILFNSSRAKFLLFRASIFRTTESLVKNAR